MFATVVHEFDTALLPPFCQNFYFFLNRNPFRPLAIWCHYGL